MAQKLRKTVLLRFGLVTFRFHFGKTRKLIIFMVFGPGGRDQDSQNQLFPTLETPNYFKCFKKKQIMFGHIIFQNLKLLELQRMENIGTDGSRTNLSNKFLNILDMESISIKKNMIGNLCIFESLKLWKIDNLKYQTLNL